MSARLEAIAGGHAHLVLPPARLRRLGLERQHSGTVAPLRRCRPHRDARPQGRRPHRCARRPFERSRRGRSGARPLVPRSPRRCGGAARRGDRGRPIHAARACCGHPRIPPGQAPRPQDREPRACTPRWCAGDRVRGFPRRRGAARPGGDHRRQARSIEARERAASFRMPDRRPVRLPQVRLRDQLRDTVRHMAQGEGGILLSRPGGCGNGLANKIRAYKLQSQGYDTTTPTRSWGSISTRGASTSPPRCCASSTSGRCGS